MSEATTAKPGIVLTERINIVAPEGDARLMRVAAAIMATRMNAEIALSYPAHNASGDMFSQQEIYLKAGQVEGFEDRLRRTAKREGFTVSNIGAPGMTPVNTRVLRPANG